MPTSRIDDEVRADLEKLRAKIAELPPKAEGEEPRRRAERWVLAVGCAGLERAGLVVVNVRGSDDRTRAAQITEEVARLQSYDAV